MGKSANGVDRNSNIGPYAWKFGQPYVNDRKVYILFKPGLFWQRHVSAVYKVTFGHRFYIGRSKLILNRWLSHNKGLNLALKHYPDYDMTNYGYYGKLIQYLLENPKIKVGYIEVLHQCENDYELWYMENKYLSDNKDNPDCCNRSFFAARPANGIYPIIQQRVYVHFRWFYNPEYDQEVVEWDEITAKGKLKRIIKPYGPDVSKIMLLQHLVDSHGFLH